MTEELDSLFPFAGPLPAGTAPAAGESLPPPPWWVAPVPLAREVAATMNYLTQRRAMDLLAAERFAEARAAFDGLLVSAPTDVNWLFMKGVCCFHYRNSVYFLHSKVKEKKGSLRLGRFSIRIAECLRFVLNETRKSDTDCRKRQ